MSMEEATTGTEKLAARLYEANLGALDLLSIFIGHRLGYYSALADGGPATSTDLATRTGTHERYAREWLEQQAATGFLQVVEDSDDAVARRFALPPSHGQLLIDKEDFNHALGAPLASALVAASTAMPKILDAFRSGSGVPWGAYGTGLRDGEADFNRAMYVKLLGQEYLPQVLDVHARLIADPPARVVDIACGAGWSSLAIARAYPKVNVLGLDLDESSIELARTNAVQAGLSDRVRFEVRDATDPSLGQEPLAESADLVTIFEALHDMSGPIEALRNVRSLLAEGASAIVMDERVGEVFTAPANEVERFMYGWSILVCLPGGMSQPPAAGTGTVMRPGVLRSYADQAGFRDVEILPIENDFFRFYRLWP